jgi:hypothetical protein
MNAQVVEIPCPRCGGEGRGTWKPDAGICYRCKGNRFVRVNVAKSEAALRFLRMRFVRLRAQARAGSALAAEYLEFVVQDGLRLKADIEEAKRHRG